MSGELVEDSVTEKISVVQQEMYKALNINKKGINAGRGPGADAFVVFVSLGGRGGCYRLALISQSPFADVTFMMWTPLTFCKGMETRWVAGWEELIMRPAAS